MILPEITDILGRPWGWVLLTPTGRYVRGQRELTGTVVWRTGR